MKKAQSAAIKLVQDTAIPEIRGEADTVRLWERFKEQASFWRAIALLQIPTSLLLIVFCIILWGGRSITLSVPAKPLPGQYLVREIPDTEFVEFATTFINLIATYQPAVARRQFNQAREMLREPMLSRFDTDMMDLELRAIETTSRSQIFFSDPVKLSFERISDHEATVSFEGERLKIVAGKELPVTKARYSITLTTVPRQSLNPYGIVITNAIFESLNK